MKIGKISGQVICRTKRTGNSQQECWKRFLTNVGGLTTFRKERSGYHLYSGGKLFLVGNPIERGEYVKLTVGFKDSKPSFVDLLFDASTRDFDTCNISFFLRDRIVDFQTFLKNLKLRYSEIREELNGNFSARIRSEDRTLELAGYPSVNILSISGFFSRNSLQPSQFLEEFVEMNVNGK